MLLCRGEGICVGAVLRFFGGRLVETRTGSAGHASSGETGNDHSWSIGEAAGAAALKAARALPPKLRDDGRFAFAGK
jgi:hypothetical protein